MAQLQIPQTNILQMASLASQLKSAKENQNYLKKKQAWEEEDRNYLLKQRELTGQKATGDNAWEKEKREYEREATALNAALKAKTADQATQIYKTLGGRSESGIKFTGDNVELDYGMSTFKGPASIVSELSSNLAKNPDYAKDKNTWAWFTKNGGSIDQKDPKETQASTTKLSKLIAERNNLQDGDPNRKIYDQAIAKEIATSKGVSLQTNPDGSVSFSMGGGGEDQEMKAPKGAKTALFKDIVANQSVMDELDYIDNLYEPEFLTYGGMWKSVKNNVLNKIDPEKRDQFTQRREAFMSATNQSFIRYRKWATGVAGGEKEMAEIKRSVPNENDSPQSYEAKSQLRKSLTRRLTARQKAALKAGVNNDAEFQKYIKEHPLDSVPTLQERGDQLLKQGYSKDQALNILLDEGYILKRK